MDATKTKSLHDQHRERMRERIVNGGIDGLKSHEILEYILYSFVPRKNTNDIAHALMEEFGSLADVLNADAERLCNIKGVTKNAALFLSSLPDIFRRYAAVSGEQKESLKGRGKVRAYLGKMLFGSRVERIFVVALDAQDNLIRKEMLSVGDGDSVQISVRRIVDFAMKCKAVSIIIAHNHPSGSVKPSQEDFMLTKELAYILDGLNVSLQDHYIFAGENYYSFDEQGTLAIMRKEKDLSLKDGVFYYE